MKIKVKNDQGEEIEQEVFTPEEVEAQREQWKKDHPDQSQELTKLQEDLKLAKQALEGAGDKGENFAALRASVQRLEGELKKKSDESNSAINQVRTEMSEAALDAAVQGLAGEDAELAKKVKFHFSETLKGVAVKNKQELTRKIQQAYLLAAGREPDPNALSGAMYASGGAGPGANGSVGGSGGNSRTSLKPELVEMGKRYFGLTDDDIKKFDKQDFSRTK